MNEIYFKTEKLTVGYDGKPLIRDIDIRLERAKLMTLIGPNGSGKSTLLKSITGQLQKIAGTVCIGGVRPEDISRRELAKKMSVMLTERIRPELMTCWDVAAAGRYPHTGRLGILSEEDKRKVEEALELVGMQEYRETEFSNVSDGQQQRVMLAGAICQDPEILILDEPTSYLDIRHKLGILQILKNLIRERGVTVIMSLHELELAQKVSDYVLCVRGEYVHRWGTPEEIFRSDYIAELYDLDNGYYDDIFGSVEMKFPGGEGKKREPEVFVIAGGGSGAAVFRRLCREEIPFAAGVLHENDIDYELARFLAAQVVTERAYERIGERSYAEALQVMKKCRCVICCLEPEAFGEMNAKNLQLLEWARRDGMKVIVPEEGGMADLAEIRHSGDGDITKI